MQQANLELSSSLANLGKATLNEKQSLREDNISSQKRLAGRSQVDISGRPGQKNPALPKQNLQLMVSEIFSSLEQGKLQSKVLFKKVADLGKNFRSCNLVGQAQCAA